LKIYLFLPDILKIKIMKKVLLFIAIVAVGFTANAQQFGVKAGLNFSNINVNSQGISASADGRTSFYVGGLVDFTISDKLHIQPEVLYSAEGSKNSDISFVNIPVMVKYYFTEEFNLQAGPQIGFVADAEGGTEGLETANFGFGFGAAYELEGGLFIDARYTLGISDIAKADAYEVDTKSFQVGLGYRF
jgi:opacity protein-like surface antigen